MAGGLVKGELLATGISALHGPLSSLHLNAVQPHGCGAMVPQLNVPPGPTNSVALVDAFVPVGSPEMAMPCGPSAPMSRPPNPVPSAGESGRSWQACRSCAAVTLATGVPSSTLRLSRGSAMKLLLPGPAQGTGRMLLSMITV